MTRYQFEPELDRWIDTETGASTETFFKGDFKVSFDIRTDASRFIMVKRVDTGFAPMPVVIARGSIESPGRGGAAIAVFDAPEAHFDSELVVLQLLMLDRYEQVCARIRALTGERA